MEFAVSASVACGALAVSPVVYVDAVYAATIGDRDVYIALVNGTGQHILRVTYTCANASVPRSCQNYTLLYEPSVCLGEQCSFGRSGGLDWWVWLLIALGAVLLILVVVLIVYCSLSSSAPLSTTLNAARPFGTADLSKSSAHMVDEPVQQSRLRQRNATGFSF